MNNDNLIRRGDVFQELDSFLAEVEEKMLSILEQYGACANRAVTNCEETTRGAVNNIRKRINAIPAVQQMSAVEYSRHRERLCNQYYRTRYEADCPLYSVMAGCAGGWSLITPEAVAIIEKWAQEHPERSEEE